MNDFQNARGHLHVEDWIERLLHSPLAEEIVSEMNIPPRFRRPTPATSSQGIHRSLNLKEDQDPMKTTWWFRVNDAIERVFTFAEGTPELTRFIQQCMEFSTQLRNGFKINYQKTVPLMDTTVVLPTELGLPCEMKIQHPLTVSFRGDIQAQIGMPTSVKANIKPL